MGMENDYIYKRRTDIASRRNKRSKKQLQNRTVAYLKEIEGEDLKGV